MKGKLQIILFLLLIVKVWADQKIYTLNETVLFSTLKQDSQVTKIFSLAGMDPKLREKEWYAFLKLQLPQKNFADKFYVQLSTVSISTKIQGQAKVKCGNTGDHMSDCFIGSSQIDTQKEYLSVKLSFIQNISGSISIEIDEVKTLKLGLKYVLIKGQPDFSRILRLDVSSFSTKFDYLVCEMKSVYQASDYQELYYFLISKELTPPNHFRFSQYSRSLWGNNQQAGYQFAELDDTEILTFTVQIVGTSTYQLKCSTVGGGQGVKQNLQLQINKSYYEIYKPKKSYHLKLPAQRKPNTGYAILLDSHHFGSVNFAYLKLNGKSIDSRDIFRFRRDADLFAKQGIIQLWLNQTYNEAEFEVLLDNSFIFQISVDEYNLQLLELKMSRAWLDKLAVNETQFFYFVANSRNGTEKISFQVQFGSRSKRQAFQLKFKNCVQKNLKLCKQAIYSNVTILQATALRPLNPTVHHYPQHTSYIFTNLLLTMYERTKNNYQSIIVIQVTSVFSNALYAIAWHPVKPLQQLQQNKMKRGSLLPQEIQSYYFNAIDTKKIHFARVDYQFQSQADIFITTKLIDFQSRNRSDWMNNQLFFKFQNSVTVPNLKSMTNYYVYVVGQAKGNYRLRLSFGYNTDNKAEHPISYLSIGQRFKTEVTLQPAQIVFIEVKVKTYTFLDLQNSVMLKFCYLTSSTRPTSHKDVVSSSLCNNFKTVNRYIVSNFNNTGKNYVAIQNEQNVSAFLKISTEVEHLGCYPVQMGEKHVFNLLWMQKDNCILYQISHKGEIQVTSDLSNPQMQGISHPIVVIGQEYKHTMTSNIKIFSANEIQEACQKQYDMCFIKITLQDIKQVKQVDSSQILLSVFVSYTDRPLLLSDGIGHPAQLARREVKHFKYALTLPRSILVTLKQNKFQEEYTIYAKLVTIRQKFQYPDSSSYKQYVNAKDKANLTQVFISHTNWILGAPNMKIGDDKVMKYCKNVAQIQCYLLLTVANTQNQKVDFSIQVTQSVHHIKQGNTENAYLAKGESDYYNFYNYNNNSNILFLVSSHASICHKISLSEGNNQFTRPTDLQRQNEIFLQKAKLGWYTLTVSATDDCYYSIQASSSEKKIIELAFGYGARLKMLANQKRYFLIRNQNLDMIKLIGGIDMNITSQVILRGIPVTDNEMSEFLKFANGEIEIGKKSKLEYAWTHRNSLVMRSTDAKYCKDCFICVEVQAVRDLSGFLAMSSNNLQNVQMNTQALMYDILLKGESFTWVFRYLTLQSLIDINLQAGAILIEVLQNDAKLLEKKELKFDKNDVTQNTFAYRTTSTIFDSYIVVKVTARQISDYSLILSHKNPNKKQNDTFNNVEIGRPKFINFTNNSSSCVKGQGSNGPTQFILVLKDDHYGKDSMKDPDQTAKKFGQILEIKATVNQIPQKTKIERIKNNFLIHFEDQIRSINKPYKLCFSLKNYQVLYRANLMLLGNLNYFTENEAIHIRRNANLTFISDGKGLIEIDECQSRATLVLSNKYDGLTKSTSNLNHRRVINNYITFNYNGPIYIGAHTDDFVTLRWKNYHSTNLNGFGYDYFSASSFRLHQSKTKQDLSLTIKPLLADEEAKNNLPEVLQVIYNIYIARQQSDLYNAMNCERGDFMHFIRKMNTKEEIQKELLVQLNNLEDVRKLFRNVQYVLITVKASLDVKWKNNSTENYRFYYPYQQLLITQAKVEDNTDKKVVEQKKPQTENLQSSLFTMVFFFVMLILAIAIVGLIIIYLRDKYKTPRLAEEDLPAISQGFSYKQAVELTQKTRNKM